MAGYSRSVYGPRGSRGPYTLKNKNKTSSHLNGTKLVNRRKNSYMAFKVIFVAGYSGQSRAAKMSPTCLLGQPITALDLGHPNGASDGSRKVNMNALIPLRRIIKQTTETIHLAPRKQQLLQRDYDYDDKSNYKPTTNAAVLIKLQRHERTFG